MTSAPTPHPERADQPSGGASRTRWFTRGHTTAELEALDEAEARAALLTATLQGLRAQLEEETEARRVSDQAADQSADQAAATRTRPAPRHHRATERIRPDGAPELVELSSPTSSAVLTVLLGLGALVGAAVAVYAAYLDRLTSTAGLVASGVTLLLVLAVARTHGPGAHVWIDHGVLHVDDGSHRRFDLSSPQTTVEMVGSPGERRWKVMIHRKGMSPYEIDGSMVHPAELVEALRPWRPELGS